MTAPAWQSELQVLIEKHLEQVLSNEERTRVNEILQNDGDARQFYLTYAYAHHALEFRGVDPELQQSTLAEVLTDRARSDQQTQDGAISSAHEVGPAPRPKSILQWASRNPKAPAFAVAATILIAALVVMGLIPVKNWMAGRSKKGGSDETHEKKDQEFVAKLSNWHNDVWLDGTRPPRDDPRLKFGRRLKIESGLIELTYLTGARVVIEGPAEFYVGGKESEGTQAQSKEETVRSSTPNSSLLNPNSSLANSGYLALGKLVARIEGEKAQGFTIDTPSVRVEDFGTEFGVEVKRSGAAEVVVLSGEVDVVRDIDDGSEQRVRLVKDEGAFVASSSARITRRKSVDLKLIAAMKNRLMAIHDPEEVVVEVPGTILYESFESVPVPLNRDRNHPHFGLGGNLPAGWTDGRTNHEASGKFSTPFGAQAAFTNGKPFMTTPEILAELLTARTTYTLTFNVARRTDHRGNYKVELLAGETILASTTGTPTKSDFSESDQIVFTPDASHAELLGETLVIRLSTNGQLQPHFDNVRLVAEVREAEEVKEPRKQLRNPSVRGMCEETVPKAVAES